MKFFVVVAAGPTRDLKSILLHRDLGLCTLWMGKNTHPAGVRQLSQCITKEVLRWRIKLSKQVEFLDLKDLIIPIYSTIPVLMNLFKDLSMLTFSRYIGVVHMTYIDYHNLKLSSI